jgi:arylsulfatase A-like enzyme
VTLAEAAAGAGLATAGFNPSNPFLTRETGYDRGFDLFIDFWDTHSRTGSPSTRGFLATTKKAVHDAVGRRSLGFLMLMQALLLEEGGQYLTGHTIVEHSRDWIRRRDGRFFLWLHFMDAHFPYQPLPGRRNWRDRLSYLKGMTGLVAGRPEPAVNSLRELYGQRVGLVDACVGELVSEIDALGLSDSTTVVVTSDHGEQLGERGRWAHGPDLHDELIRVPLILRGPGVGRSLRIDRQVELLGLAPTLLELLGIQIPPSFVGASFASLAESGAGGGSETVFSEAMHSGGRLSRAGVADTLTVTSCRMDGWKYIHDTENGGEELYDLDADPAEQNNLAGGHLDQLVRFRRLVGEHRRTSANLAATLEADVEQTPTPDDAEMRRRLAALGYL